MTKGPNVLAAGTKCLAFHGPLLYEAKIIKSYNPAVKQAMSRAPPSEGGEKKADISDLPSEFKEKVAYFVHYKGWKSTWDEWIAADRVLQWNEENLRTQKELKQAALAAVNQNKTKKTAASSSSTAGAATNGVSGSLAGETSSKRKDAPKEESGLSFSRSHKRSRPSGQDDLEREEDFIKRLEINIMVPDSLKSLLVDDWEYITKEHQLLSLPQKPNVVEILKKYRDSKPKMRVGSSEAEILDEVISGLKLYFDRSLGNMLLYRFERQQYLEIRKAHPDKEMSELYGAQHLLRLFVSLPNLIALTNMDPQGVSVLKDHLEDCLQFLAKNRDQLFTKAYENTSQRYEAFAKGV
ncbi:Eaf3p [Sugiyamaella lignohabitans]|uniref:Chromatin modification-related protein EAF3 n=1 Tax=Sugiyamaella lignohabitans TaxID=796027 RepID=A0A167CQA4_9ASCO|nr:Eaf3p [Sugiyamaella lignohabitans]ANB11976.1 Eaf3p [Sugiyamaella lignohabitans]